MLYAVHRNGFRLFRLRCWARFPVIALSHLGHRVTLALGLEEGLRRMRQAMPDLVMSDVRMDDGDGFEFVTEVRNDPAIRRYVRCRSFSSLPQPPAKKIATGN